MKFQRIQTLAVCLVFCVTASAQSSKSFTVRGEITNFPAGETLSIELRPVTHTGAAQRELAGNDGSFEVHNVEPGTYEANVLTVRGTSLRREIVHLDSFSNRFTIQLPKPAPGSAHGGTISLKRLAFKPSKAARKLHAKAQSEADRKHLPEAIAMLRQVVEMEPEWAEAYNNLGVQYYRQMRFAEACAAMAEAYRIDPDSAEIGSNYSVALIPMNRAAEAEALIRRTMLRHGETPKGRFVLGMALAARGNRKEEARALLTEVSEQFPSAKAFLNGMR